MYRVHEALCQEGICIDGDIIRPDYAETKWIYRTRWIRMMTQAGLPQADIEQNLHP